MKVKTDWPEQAFVLSKELLDAVSVEEIEATYADMEELGIAKPPYESFDLIVPPESTIQVVDYSGTATPAKQEDFGELRARYLPRGVVWLARKGGVTINLEKRLEEIEAEMQDGRSANCLKDFANAAVRLRKLLVVMLATRNAVKERKECKTLRLGIGSRERNRYTTTIKVGRAVEHTEGMGGPGTRKRPHLRRGHIRRQHYGPNRELVKQIFIEPLFVNADEGWIAARTAYNVSLAR